MAAMGIEMGFSSSVAFSSQGVEQRWQQRQQDLNTSSMWQNKELEVKRLPLGQACMLGGTSPPIPGRSHRMPPVITHPAQRTSALPLTLGAKPPKPPSNLHLSQAYQGARLPLGKACMQDFSSSQADFGRTLLHQPNKILSQRNIQPQYQPNKMQAVQSFAQVCSPGEQLTGQVFQPMTSQPTYIMAPPQQPHMYKMYETAIPNQAKNLAQQTFNPPSYQQAFSNTSSQLPLRHQQNIDQQQPHNAPKQYQGFQQERQQNSLPSKLVNLTPPNQPPRLRLSQACLQSSFIDSPSTLNGNQTQVLPLQLEGGRPTVLPSVPLAARHVKQPGQLGQVGLTKQTINNGLQNSAAGQGGHPAGHVGHAKEERINGWQSSTDPSSLQNKLPETQELKIPKPNLGFLAPPIKSSDPPQSQSSMVSSGLMMESENKRYEQRLLSRSQEGRKTASTVVGGSKRRKPQPPPQVPLVTVANACRFLNLVDYPVPVPVDLDPHHLPRFLSTLESFEEFFLPMLATVNPGRGMLQLKTLAKAKRRQILENTRQVQDQSGKRGKTSTAFTRKPRMNRVRLNMRV